MTIPRLDRVEARRIAVRAQLLDADRPTGLLAVVNQLTLLQLDPTAAVAPSADLVEVSHEQASKIIEYFREKWGPFGQPLDP